MIPIITTAFFWLLFLGFAALWETNKTRLHNFMQERFQVIVKNSWDTIVKGFALAGLILFVKKFLYYISFFGVTQIESSIKFVDADVLMFIWFVFALFVVGAAAVGFVSFISVSKGQDAGFGCMTILFFAGLIGGIPTVLDTFKIESLTFNQGFTLFIFAPLLIVKMLCSGKYLGLFTGFLLGCLIINRYKKLKPEITEKNVRLLLVPALILLIFFIASFNIFSGGWKPKSQDKVPTIKSEAASFIKNKGKND